MTQMHQGIHGLAALGAIVALGASVPVHADGDLITLAPMAEATTLALGDSAPISEEVLGAENAMAQIQLDKIVVNHQSLDGVVQGNVAINTHSGNNSVSGDAFSDSAGFVTVIQNTGNNVLIQNSTIVNVALDP